MTEAHTHETKYCDGESWWSRFLKYAGLSHGQCKTDLDGYNTELFVQIFAFWKLFLLFFFLLLIGAANLATNWEKTIKYMRDNKLNFGLEFLLLFAAFFVSTIFMYGFRLWARPQGIWTIPVVTIVLLIFCVFKHLAFEMSGLYRYNFGSKVCKEEKKKKEKELFESSKTDEEKKKEEADKKIKKESMTEEEKKKEEEKEEKIKNCKCDDGFFTGLLWNGLGYYGMFLTPILLLFFGMAALNPDGWTKSLFNYQFERYQSIGYIVIGIGVPFAIGCLFNNIFAEKTGMNECPKDENYIFTYIKNGCACVSIAFMTLITALLPIALFCWARGYSLDHISTKDDGTHTTASDYLSKRWKHITVGKPAEGEAEESKPHKFQTTEAIYETKKIRAAAAASNYSCPYRTNPDLDGSTVGGFIKMLFLTLLSKRFILILIESIIIYLIFVIAEAGIKHLRTGEDYTNIISSREFWEHSAMLTLPGIVVIQILLEYTDWFKGHLFGQNEAPPKPCDGKDTETTEAPAAAAKGTTREEARHGQHGQHGHA